MSSPAGGGEFGDTSQERVPLLQTRSDHRELPHGHPEDGEDEVLTLCATIRSLFAERRFVMWLIFKVVFFTQVFAAGLFIPMYAAEYFGGCLKQNNINTIHGCVPDYTTYDYWGTMFLSIGGLITFFTSSYIGHLSDRFGRKLFFFVAIITWMIPRCVMIFWVDFYVYFGLSLLTSINGDNFFIASKGYIADIFPNKEKRGIAFGFGQSAVGIGCILGAVMAIGISEQFNDHAVFIGLGVLYILMLLFTAFCIKEPDRFARHEASPNDLSDEQRQQSTALNPCKYMGKVTKFSLIFNVSMVALLMSIVESGVMTSLFAYIGNEFHLNEEGSSTVTYAVFSIIASLALCLTGFLFVAFKRLYDEINIMIIAICFKMVSLLLMASISMYPQDFRNFIVLYLSSFVMGISYVFWPSLIGLLTKYISAGQQGTGFGIVDSWSAIANIIAPFGFGSLYVFLDGIHRQWMLFIFALCFCAVSLVIVAFPLRKAIKEQVEPIDFETDGDSEMVKNEDEIGMDVVAI